MRSVIFCAAFCAAAQAIPVSIADGRRSILDDGANILIGRSGYVLSESEIGVMGKKARSADVQARDVTDNGSEVNRLIPEVTTTASIISDATTPPSASGLPSSTAIVEEEASDSEEDPALSAILTHIEEILDSTSPTSEQIQWILDSILHHTESPRESHQDLWEPSSLLGLVDRILADPTASDDQKLESIYGQIVAHTKHQAGAELHVREPVLYRIRAVLYGDESKVKKIKNILNEIADYLESQPSEADDGFGAQAALGESLEDISTVGKEGAKQKEGWEGDKEELADARMLDR